MKKLLISACLLGIPCRYDGRSVKAVDIECLAEKFELIPVCPEIYGGLSTPRTPSERVGDKTLMKDGRDVTENYLRGAEAAYSLCESLGCTLALLKERSPSCGKNKIYDGSFTGTLIDGEGVTAEYLRERGIKIFGESEIEELLKEVN
jgi:uncharacterized protein YbbK (DUF523 family)